MFFLFFLSGFTRVFFRVVFYVEMLLFKGFIRVFMGVSRFLVFSDWNLRSSSFAKLLIVVFDKVFCLFQL